MRFTFILTIMALPAFAGHLLPRFGMLAASLGISLAPGARWLFGGRGSGAAGPVLSAGVPAGPNEQGRHDG